METAGLVLDLYDSPKDLREIFPSVDVIPEAVKTAHALTPQERDELPDDVYALVLMTGGDRLRKYACIDEGNTLLNLAYFFKHGHKLPAVAQKTAAASLATACGWYGIEVPEELNKVAFGISTVMNALTLPSQLKGAGSQIKDNLTATQAAGGLVMPTHQQHALTAMAKGAEASGTSLMPLQDPGNLSSAGLRGKPGSSNTSAAKQAAVGHLVTGHRGETGAELETTRGAEGEQYQKAPQTPTQGLRPHVSVLGTKPPVKMVAKEASITAYQGMYPLDNYLQVKTASAYFDTHVRDMPPEMRHEFAVSMVKRASAMGIPYSDRAAAYGSETFAADEQIRVALDTRRPYLTEKQAAVLDTMYMHRAELGPAQFAETLSEFDKLAEIDWRYDQAVLDPYASTFGLQKTAADTSDSWINGNDYVTKKQLENYAITAALTIHDDYGKDFLKEFQKDAWGIFQSLPVDQKRRLARAATDNGATGLHDVQ